MSGYPGGSKREGRASTDGPAEGEASEETPSPPTSELAPVLPLRPPPDGFVPQISLERVIHRRSSIRAFTRDPITQDQLAALMDNGIRPIQTDYRRAAYALGIGATGLTFYDEAVEEFLGVSAEGLKVMFLLAVGLPK